MTSARNINTNIKYAEYSVAKIYMVKYILIFVAYIFMHIRYSFDIFSRG